MIMIMNMSATAIITGIPIMMGIITIRTIIAISEALPRDMLRQTQTSTSSFETRASFDKCSGARS
jgi:hypothetical protein